MSDARTAGEKIVDAAIAAGATQLTVQLVTVLASERDAAIARAEAAERERGLADQLAAALLATRDELAKHGWGDMHYGDMPQKPSVVAAIAFADEALAAARVFPQPQEGQ